MATLEKIVCGTQTYNQGYGVCVTDLPQLDYLIGIVKGRVLSKQEIADLEDTLSDLSKADNALDRGYLIGKIVNFESANTDAPTESFSDNSSIHTGLGQWGYTARIIDGGFCGFKNLIKLHLAHERFDFLHVHGGRYLGGVKAKDANGDPGIMGVDYSDFFVPNFIGATGSTKPTYSFNAMVSDATQVREDYTFIDLKLDGINLKNTMKAIQDVVMDAATVGGNHAIQLVTLITACGGVNLADTYGTELADPAAWLAFNDETGGQFNILSVTLSNGKFTVTADDIDPDYPATGTWTLQLVPLSALAGLGIVGYEANKAVIDLSASS